MKKIIVIGGGAAGFFTAINAKENNPDLEVVILEKGNEVLQKVKISGGGRCNVTHACFDPKDLVKFYPRGGKELLGPFHQFMTGDTFQWFEDNGVPLKIESDGRAFPESNSSQTIIDCFLNKTKELNISVLKNHGVLDIEKNTKKWVLKTKEQDFSCDALVVAAGSSKQVWKILSKLGHTIIEPVPSLFTFNIKDDRFKDLAGISVPNAEIKLLKTNLEAKGPLLITHWGMSGPAVLKLSAFGARILEQMNYEYQVEVNWISDSFLNVFEKLTKLKEQQATKKVSSQSPFTEIPKRFWEKLVLASQIQAQQNWAETSKKQIECLTKELTQGIYSAKGKSTFKDEFVTAGGVDLKEINFKTFESKLHNNLFLLGEIINVDAVTGGFNFQNAWTGGWIVANAISK